MAATRSTSPLRSPGRFWSCAALDVLSSDYVPASLLMAALVLPKSVPTIGLADAIRTVTKTPAEAVGLTDQVLEDPREAYTQLLVSSILPP